MILVVLTAPNCKEAGSLDDISELVNRAGAGNLSPEWIKISPLLDRPTNDVSEVPAIDAVEHLVEFAVATTELANEFAGFDTSYLEIEDFETFRPNLDKHLRLYNYLGATHGIEGRLESFVALEKGLERYVEYYEGQRGERVGKYSRSYKRLWASVLEEIGEYTNEPWKLQKALGINQEIANDNSISYLKRYKLHAMLAKYDIADRLAGNTRELDALGLPTNARERQANFYQDIYDFARLARVEIQAAAEDNIIAAGNIAAALAEAGYIGFLRDEVEWRGLNKQIVITQSYPHQDTKMLPNALYKSFGGQVPRSSFDVRMFDLETGESLQIDVKKFDDYKRREYMLPNTIVVKLRNHIDDYGFIERVRSMARGFARLMRGEELSDNDLVCAIEFQRTLSFDELLDRHRQRIGEERLRAA
jgi:hypothetical protein